MGLTDEGLGEVCDSFRKEKIVGKDLPVGARLRLVKLSQAFKVGHMIATKNKKMWEDPEWYLCPCFVPFKKRYTLTQSSLTIYKGACCKKTYDRVDVTSF